MGGGGSGDAAAAAFEPQPTPALMPAASSPRPRSASYMDAFAPAQASLLPQQQPPLSETSAPIGFSFASPF